MTAFYIATDQGVDMTRTQSLFLDFSAIWCPPPSLRSWNGSPEAGDQITLGFLQDGNLYLLGVGYLASNDRDRFGTDLLFTDTDARGVRAGAEALGYGGGNAMSFLILRNVFAFDQPFPCLPAPDGMASGMQVFIP